MKTLTLLLLLFICSTVHNSTFAQDDPKYGVIKVRKPKPIEFFVEIDYVPQYLKGDLYDDLYKNLDEIDDQNQTIWMHVIMDEHGQVIWAEERDKQSNETIKTIVEALKKLRAFEPHSEKGINVPSQFLVPVKI